LLTTLVNCKIAGTAVGEISMAVLCNLTHDICCQLDLLEDTGVLQHVLVQAFSHSQVLQRHVAGTLGNLTHVLESTPTGGRLANPGVPTICSVAKRLVEVDDQSVSFRSSAILYGLTRKPDFCEIFADLTGVSRMLLKLFR
ncbi:unnamed protein product, partial [Sphacelaria rigidula]